MSAHQRYSPVIIIAVLSSFQAVRGYDFAGGTGEPNDPYQIATAEQLVSIGSDPNLLDKHFVLLNDIDLDPNLPGGPVLTRAVIAPDRGSGPGVPSGGGGGRTKDAARDASLRRPGRSPVQLSAGAVSAGASDGIPIVSASGVKVYAGASLRANPVFTGSFDGRGHCIRNMTFQEDQGNAGLFGYVGRAALISDLSIEDVNVPLGSGALVGWNEGRLLRCHAQGCIHSGYGAGLLAGTNTGDIVGCGTAGVVSGTGRIGGLVGYNAGVIINSHAACRILLPGDPPYSTSSPGARQAGGLVGYNDYFSLILNCYATGDVCATAGGRLGGLVGEDWGFIAHSYATGDVSTGDTYVKGRDGGIKGCYSLGGLVGYAMGDISDCYATGNVSGGANSHELGGLAGTLYNSITNSYATGRVQGDPNSTGLGGLVGAGPDNVHVSNCFWDIETSGLSESRGGTGLTTAQMQDMSTFLDAGWDWTAEGANGRQDLWFIPEGGGYPMLTIFSQALPRHELSGSGTSEDPYRLAGVEDLEAVNRYDLTACYRLETDIDLAGIVWNKAPIPFFSGKFDGAGRVISGLEIQGDFLLGLFGYLSGRASVANLGVRDAHIEGMDALGSLAGVSMGGITACYARGATVAFRSSGSSESHGGSVGSLVGRNWGSITDSYGTGSVTLDDSTFGLGGLAGSTYGTIRRCYAAARVSWADIWPDALPGGLVGRLPPSYQFINVIEDSFFLIEAEGGGPDNGFGIALTDAQMRRQENFIGWDFEKVWSICEGRGYPHLRWEQVPCEEGP